MLERIVYVNGEYVPEGEARISVFDRGFLFADAVYEVTSVLNGKLIDFFAHMNRLDRSLRELDMKCPTERDQLLDIHRKLLELNKIEEGLVYMQVSRGAADRDFTFPETEPSLVLFTQSKALLESPKVESGIKVISIDDLRWGRRDIKTVQLLYPSMGKMMAQKEGADDAWLVEDGYVTEGTSNNAYIVTDTGRLVTRNLSNDILHGITRAAVLRLAREAQITVEERPFTIEEAKLAKEALITSASNFVLPVVEVDKVQIGNGSPGPITKRLREIYLEESVKTAL